MLTDKNQTKVAKSMPVKKRQNFMNFHISVAHLFDTIAKSVYQLYNISKWVGLSFNELSLGFFTWPIKFIDLYICFICSRTFGVSQCKDRLEDMDGLLIFCHCP